MSTAPEWRPVGSVKGPQGPPGLSIEVVPFSMQGALRVSESVGRFPIVSPGGATYRIASVGLAVETEPLGSPIIVDIRVNGLSIYDGLEANRPRIEPGEFMGVGGAHNDVVMSHGDYLNCDVVAVGAFMPGTFLTAAIRMWRGGRDTSP